MAIETLTPRQREVLELVAEGMCNNDIAAQLGIKEITVRSHLVNIFNKLTAFSRTQAAAHLWKERIAKEWRGG